MKRGRSEAEGTVAFEPCLGAEDGLCQVSEREGSLETEAGSSLAETEVGPR